jgi:hypothetical protein
MVVAEFFIRKQSIVDDRLLAQKRHANQEHEVSQDLLADYKKPEGLIG